MAIALKKRRVVAIRAESPNGTHVAPVPSTDAIPMLRAADAVITPISVDRPTIRLSLTKFGDIYPGKATVQIDCEFEMHANSLFTGDAGASEQPVGITRALRGCGFNFYSDAAVVRGYKLTTVTGTGPMRHKEQITGTGITTGNNWRVVGDTYSDDGQLFIDVGTGTLIGTALTGVDSGSIATIVNTAGPIIYAWDLNSDVNASLSTEATAVSVSLYRDNKLLRAKGCMGNIEFRFRFGDAVIGACSFQGVLVDTSDTAIPGTVLEAHKAPPTFLGPRLTIKKGVNAATNAQCYGTAGAAAGIEGALTEMDLRTGNNVVLHRNAIDPNGVNYAFITSRSPEGRFNPEEVTSAEFDWVGYFIAGEPVRMRTTVIGPNSSGFVFDDPATANQNIFDWIVPGVTLSEMGDGDRDGINTWDGSFKIRGGDYDADPAIEVNGNDNELVILHR